ncbi:MAG: heme ABC transporter ATP-binding protein [Thermoproteota archaeon]|nr:MAG: heme ABC transporter ATP-binding protein [Candidatus Korarchaeota archaeon]
MKGIVKTFPGVVANDHIDFEVRAGEIHALLGENGAGKTTLMNILFGIYQPDEGEIYVRGKRVEIRSPRDAMHLGIGMVHQHFMLVEKHTVAENIALGFATKFFFPTEEIARKIREFSEKYGLTVDPHAYIWQLSAGEQQRVEIIKALYRGADILILDEPTSVLTPKETNELFSILKRMREEGKAIIFITHKLDEVFAISDRVTVLRKGKVIGKLKTSETNKKELARLMVGREVLFRLEREPVQKGKIVLEVIDLHALNDKGLPALKGVSFTIAEGEILGLAGVAGNGQKELVEVLTGLRKAEKGKVLIRGVDVTNASPRRIAELGVAHIPEERLKHGLVPNMSVAENLILKRYYKQPYCDKFFIDKKKVLKDAEELIDKFNIMTPSPMTPAKLLSGGNIQRLILARELAGSPDVIIAAHPTYGLDVGATEYIRKILLKERKRGSAILLVSEDLEEIMELSDRIAVMFEGEIMGILPAEKANLEDIGLMMAGAKRMGVVA